MTWHDNEILFVVDHFFVVNYATCIGTVHVQSGNGSDRSNLVIRRRGLPKKMRIFYFFLVRRRIKKPNFFFFFKICKFGENFNRIIIYCDSRFFKESTEYCRFCLIFLRPTSPTPHYPLSC